MTVIDLPERKDYRALVDMAKSLKEHKNSLQELETAYWKILNQAAALTAEYQLALQMYVRKVGVKNIPEELLEFAWILIDPDTGEVGYLSTEKAERDPFNE